MGIATDDLQRGSSASGTISANGGIFVVSAEDFASISVQISGTFVGSLILEVSNNKTTWVQKTDGIVTPTGAAPANPITSAQIIGGDVGEKYVRLRATAWTSGAAQIDIELSRVSRSSSKSSQTVAATSGTSLEGAAEDAALASDDRGFVILGQRVPTTPAAQTSAAADAGTFAIDSEGKQVQAGSGAAEVTAQSRVYLTTTSDIALRAAQAEGIRTYVKGLILENTGASASRILIKDGSTVIASFTVPDAQTLVVSLDQPLRGTAATALNATLGAAGTVAITSLTFSGV